MLCEKCGKNNATTHIRSVVNGVVTEKHLCACCAANEGYSDMQGNNLTQLLSSMFGDIMAANSSMGAVRCKCCGGAFADIAESGKVGCPECYKTFYNELLPYLKRVHGSTKHIGKIPNKAPSKMFLLSSFFIFPASLANILYSFSMFSNIFSFIITTSN